VWRREGYSDETHKGKGGWAVEKEVNSKKKLFFQQKTACPRKKLKITKKKETEKKKGVVWGTMTLSEKKRNVQIAPGRGNA